MQKQSSPANNGGKFRIRYEEQLNFPQLQAVTTTEGPLTVIAGAGRGETRTLTYRVARLVEEGVSPAYSTSDIHTQSRPANASKVRRHDYY